MMNMTREFAIKEFIREIVNRDIKFGINVNDKDHDFTKQILSGEKTIETRVPFKNNVNRGSLHAYVGKRVGLVRTGKGGMPMLVGFVTVGRPIKYDSVKQFRSDYNRHRVEPNSKFDIDDRGKWGYPMMNPEAVVPIAVNAVGRVVSDIQGIDYLIL
jgi:hypothetical protein